jgi:hypothetical protein
VALLLLIPNCRGFRPELDISIGTPLKSRPDPGHGMLRLRLAWASAACEGSHTHISGMLPQARASRRKPERGPLADMPLPSSNAIDGPHRDARLRVGPSVCPAGPSLSQRPGHWHMDTTQAQGAASVNTGAAPFLDIMTNAVTDRGLHPGVPCHSLCRGCEDDGSLWLNAENTDARVADHDGLNAENTDDAPIETPPKGTSKRQRV